MDLGRFGLGATIAPGRVQLHRKGQKTINLMFILQLGRNFCTEKLSGSSPEV
jgi:hypothetical protein